MGRGDFFLEFFFSLPNLSKKKLQMHPYWLLLNFVHFAAFFFNLTLAFNANDEDAYWIPASYAYLLSAILHFLFFASITFFDVHYPPLLLQGEIQRGDLFFVFPPRNRLKCAMDMILSLFLIRLYAFGILTVCLLKNKEFLVSEGICFFVDICVGMIVAYGIVDQYY